MALRPELVEINRLLCPSPPFDFVNDPVGARHAIQQLRDAAPKPETPSTVSLSSVEGPRGLRLLVVKPSQRASSAVLLWLHDGGGIFGSPEANLPLYFLLVERLGITCVAPAYRLAPESPHPASLDDSIDCYDWLHSADGAKSLDIDSVGEVVISGSSFGGFLAGRAAQLLVDRPIPPVGVLLDCPVTSPASEQSRVRSQKHSDLHIWTHDNTLQAGRTVKTPQDAYPSSAHGSLLAKLPPHFVGLAEVDSLTPDALEYARKLVINGVSTGVHLEQRVFHCFASVMPHLPVAQAFNARYIDFLREVFSSSKPRVIILTGSNRGIGLALAEKIASSRQEPTALICTSRAGQPSQSVIESATSHCEVHFCKLDISCQESIDALVDLVTTRFGGRIDVCVNNGGVNADNSAEYTYEVAKQSCDVNYRGNLRMSQAVLPLMPKGGRIVTLTSAASQQPVLPPFILDRMNDPQLSLDGLEKLMQEYEKSVKAPSKEDGWAHDVFLPTYSHSKLAINLFTRVLAREHPDLLINCCCPGACDTEMGNMVPGGKPPKTAADGAGIPFKLATGDIKGVSGQYWANRLMSSKADGEVLAHWQGLPIKTYG